AGLRCGRPKRSEEGGDASGDHKSSSSAVGAPSEPSSIACWRGAPMTSQSKWAAATIWVVEAKPRAGCELTERLGQRVHRAARPLVEERPPPARGTGQPRGSPGGGAA